MKPILNKPAKNRLTSFAAALLPLLMSLPTAADTSASGPQTAPTTPPPACQTKEYRQFDFWLGQWQVKDGKGNIVGHSKITSIVKGCAISENWTSAGGNHGVSYNFYDNTVNQWHQTWIDVQGSALYLDGSFDQQKAAMVLSGETINAKGVKTLQRISWSQLADASVKQHWQTSTDGGKNWADAFVGYYFKQENK
ncbi:MAG: hypothetical protein ACI8WB_003783 [Phenylobacterium sp.]|jgi:hypothetical protein